MQPFWANRPVGRRPLWRVSTAPARGHEFAALIAPSAQLFSDWAGGLIWVALPPSDDAGAAAIRRAFAATGGHATLVRAPAAVRAAVDVFEPQTGALARVDQAREGELRSQGCAQSGPHVGGGVMQTILHPRPARRSEHRGSPKRSCAPACIAASAPRPARPMCCSATSSTFPARAHLPHQGDAGARPAGDRGGRQAHRPLPVVPLLHDHVPVRRALHAPRRSRPRPHRGNLPPAAASTG